jgi:hypothetical protein
LPPIYILPATFTVGKKNIVLPHAKRRGLQAAAVMGDKSKDAG